MVESSNGFAMGMGKESPKCRDARLVRPRLHMYDQGDADAQTVRPYVWGAAKWRFRSGGHDGVKTIPMGG